MQGLSVTLCLLVALGTVNADSASQGKNAQWDVRVFTSQVKNAGTDVYAYLAVYGSYGWTDKMILDESATDDNEQGQMDIHHFNSSDVGRPLKVLVWHTSSTSSWHLAKIEIQQKGTAEKYVFNVNRWLDSKSYDGSTTIELETDFWGIVDELRSRLEELEYQVDPVGKKRKRTLTASMRLKSRN